MPTPSHTWVGICASAAVGLACWGCGRIGYDALLDDASVGPDALVGAECDPSDATSCTIGQPCDATTRTCSCADDRIENLGACVCANDRVELGTACVTPFATVAGFPTLTGYVALAVDSRGHPHLAYEDANTGQVGYARWTGAAWEVEVLDPGPSVGRYLRLALDGNDRPHATYVDESVGLTFKYATREGSRWAFETVDARNGSGRYSSLRVDSDGVPRVVYFVNGRILAYAQRSGGSWQTEQVDTSFELASSLFIDATGQPHVAYFDPVLSETQYATKPAAAWVTESTGAGNGQTNAIALNGNGEVTIAARGGGVEFLNKTAGAWSQEVPVDPRPAAVRSLSLQYDSQGQAHIAFVAENSDVTLSEIRYVRQTSNTWDSRIIATGSQRFVGFALDDQDRPHFAYGDATGAVVYALPAGALATGSAP